MVSFPNAKINLGLRVLNKRPDGYHDIESCFLPVNWTDVLEIIKSGKEKLSISGLSVPGAWEENLCWKAYSIIKKEFDISPVHIHLHKVIPMGGGIGGGSADAAFTIKVLNELFSLDLNEDKMEFYASQVGSDCPFFINNQPAIATGRGTDLKLIDPGLEGKSILLVNPNIHISTAEAYNTLKIGSGREGELKNILMEPLNTWPGLLINDFENYAFQKHNEIKKLKEELYRAGALYASMTGSGATVYGIFDQQEIDFLHPTYASWKGTL